MPSSSSDLRASVLNPSLRIAHVDAERGFSGGEVQVFLLMDGLVQRGHRNLLVCPPGSGAAAEAARRGIATRAVPMRGALDVAAVWRLTHHLRAAGVDLVHLHTGRAAWLGGLALLRAGLPAIVTRRMDRPIGRGWRTRLVYTRVARRVAAIAPGIVEQLVAGGVPRRHVVLIPSAVDPARIAPRQGRAATRAGLGAAPADVVLLAAAALVHRKGLDVLLDALTALAARGQRPPLWLAGDGPAREPLQAQASARGLAAQVRFLGARDDIGDLLAACDVFVLPARAEGLGVAALEAMAAARPLVVSEVGGLADAVEDGRQGLLVPPGDPIPLAAALESLLLDPARRAALGAAGPARVAARYSADAMVDAYERLYFDVLREPSPR